MIEVRMKTISSGPLGARHPGEVYPVPDSEARELVKGGYAEFATIRPPEKAIDTPQEAAVVKPKETATLTTGSDEKAGNLNEGPARGRGRAKK
jgi:hypothetical protein